MFLLAALLPAGSAAGKLDLIRRIGLSDYMRVAAPSWFEKGARVSGLAFSPDGEWIAIAASGADGTRLFVVSRERSASNLRYSGRVPPFVGPVGQILWAPGGKALALATTPPVLINLETERSCELAGGDAIPGGFASDTEVLMARGRRLLVSGLDCEPLLQRDLPSAAVSLDVAPGLAAVATDDNRTVVFDTGTGEKRREWRRGSRVQTAFASGGRILCAASPPAKDRTGPECWPVDGDGPLVSIDATGGAPFRTARDRPMAAFTDGRYGYDSVFDHDRRGVKRGVIVTITTGKTVATWKPESLPCSARTEMFRECEVPSPFALSSSGEFFAEARSTEVRLYRVRD